MAVTVVLAWDLLFHTSFVLVDNNPQNGFQGKMLTPVALL
jgi:hypothetical protein